MLHHSAAIEVSLAVSGLAVGTALAMSLAACGDGTRSGLASDGAGAGGTGGAVGDGGLGTGNVAALGGNSPTATNTSTNTEGGPDGDCSGSTFNKPPSVPDGYVDWRCWHDGCRLWVPGSVEAMPPPVAWEPCDETPQPGLECRQMVVDWDAPSWPIGILPKIGFDGTGAPHLLYEKRASDHWEWIVAAIDGPTRFAMRRSVGNTIGVCSLQTAALRDNRFLLEFSGEGIPAPQESLVSGAIVGTVDTGEFDVLYKEDSDLQAIWTVGADLAARVQYPGGMLYATRITDGESFLVDEQAATGIRLPVVVGNAIVWDSVTFDRGIRAYDEVLGPHDLLRYNGDATQGVGNVGTDGIDLVWTHGYNKPQREPLYPDRDIYTAPFTTDPADLEPRRLRKDLSQQFAGDDGAFTVGCGYAVRPGTTTAHKQIVRLSDGWGWELLGTSSWKWNRALAVTCDELFVRVSHIGFGPRIVRVRLDSLGPGSPPD